VKGAVLKRQLRLQEQSEMRARDKHKMGNDAQAARGILVATASCEKWAGQTQGARCGKRFLLTECSWTAEVLKIGQLDADCNTTWAGACD